MREINQAGLNLIKSFERCCLVAYQDQGGIWTIGYGHTDPIINDGMTITQDEAESLLKQDLQKFYHLDDFIAELVNDNQYSALICLAFNVGLRAVKLSQTLKLINAGDNPDKEWMGFNKVNGVVSQGLINRRKAELKLYHTLG